MLAGWKENEDNLHMKSSEEKEKRNSNQTIDSKGKKHEAQK